LLAHASAESADNPKCNPNDLPHIPCSEECVTDSLKALTAENWLSVDPAWKIGPTKADVQEELQAWIAPLVNHRLASGVPAGLREVHTVARGALIYSLLYRPLLILGIEQSVRVAEAAASFKCKDLDAPRSIRSFADKIAWLVEQDIIGESQVHRWHQLRQLRSFGSPVERTHLLNPEIGLSVFGAVTSLVDELFR
jgi:hypothetical protein